MQRFVEWLRREPVRVRLYSLVVLVAGYALARGYVSATDVEFVAGVAALVLGVERARAKVSPVDPEDA